MSQWMKFTHMQGQVYAPESRSAGVGDPIDRAMEESALERFDTLMSLALDDRLTNEEAAEFEQMLSGDGNRGEVWSHWQAFDHAFRSTPALEPPVDFVAAFEHRVIQRERRHRLWFGFGVGAIAVLLWSGLIAGFAGASAYVMFNQSGWLTTAVRAMAQWGATVESQAVAFTSATVTVLSTPQMQLMAVAYMLFAGLALWYWARFLRRSVAEQRTFAASIS